MDAVKDFARTGSREICDPPPLDTDEDFVCLVGSIRAAVYNLRSLGFVSPPLEYDPEFSEQIPFETLRRGEENLILYESVEGFNAWVAATKVAKSLNLTKKSDRIALFRAVRSGRSARR